MVPDVGELADRTYLALLVFVPFVIHLWLAAALPLTEDEAYYRLWALGPALSYLDHPPMVGWLMAAGRYLVGDSALGLRLPAVVMTAVSTLVVWRLALLLSDRTTARLAVGFAVVIPLLSVGAVIMTPDTPSVFFFLLGALALAELNALRDANWWIGVGLAAGLGLLSKYTNFFFGITILLWLVIVPSNRRWFRSWQLYAGGALALLVFAPVIIWNIRHEGASFAKQFGRVLSTETFKLSWSLELWGAMALLLSPIIFWLALKGLARTFRNYRERSDPVDALLLCLILPLLIYFSYHALHGRVLPNWLAPIYPLLAILAAIGVGDYANAAAMRRAALYGTAVALGISLIIYTHAVMPFYVSEKIKDPTHQMRGWPEFTAEIDAAARKAGAAYIATTSYGTTGQLAFYLDEHWPVLQLNERLRYVNLPQPSRAVLNQTGLVVDLARRRPLEQLRSKYQTITDLGLMTRKFRGEPLQKYAVFIVSDPFADPLDANATVDKRN